MKTVVPNYYNRFQCIADRCRHSCCIGWEIDIDEDSLSYYNSIDGDFAAHLAKNIETDGEFAHFRLVGKEERCPFLKENGLCEMIITLGEESLCDICREHPRFYHAFSDREEIGLGLCCEEAARIILSQKTDTVLLTTENDGETEALLPWENTLIAMREALFALLQKRDRPVSVRAEDMLTSVHAVFPEKSCDEWCELLISLEQLDPSWQEILTSIRDFQGKIINDLEMPFEKLLLYFIYRHTAEAENQDDLSARVAFAYLGYHIIRLLCSEKKEREGVCDFSDLAEFARRYSSEIEYSEKNTDALLTYLSKNQIK